MSFFRRKQPIARQRPTLKAIPASPEASAAEPAPGIDPRLAHPPRQVAWAGAARILGVSTMALALTSIALATIVFDLAGRIRIQPMLLTVSPKSDQIVRVEPFQVGTRGFDAITEAMLADYVRVRHSVLVDRFEMRRRWGGEGHVWRLSTADEYKKFLGELRRGAGKLLDGNITRAVYPLSNPVRVDTGFYRVDFATVDCDPSGAERDRAAWTASVTIGYAPQEVRVEDRYVNPIGLQVAGYSVQRKHDGEARGVGGCLAESADGVIEALSRSGLKRGGGEASQPAQRPQGAQAQGARPPVSPQAARPVQQLPQQGRSPR